MSSLPSVDSDVIVTLVVWSSDIGLGSTSTMSASLPASRMASTGCCWSALRVVKNTRLPRTCGTLRVSTLLYLANVATT